MRALVTGGDGQLARALTQLPPRQIELRAPNRTELDICDTNTLASQLDDFRPDVIINTAAYTGVDRAEQEPSKAIHVNADAVGRLGSLCAARGDVPYKPNDPTHPVNQYGKSKLEGEKSLLASGADCQIIRTSWLYAPWGNNFLTSMHKLMEKKLMLQIICDQTGTPTSVLDLAPAIWQFALEKDPVKDSEQIRHWTNQGEATWFEFAYAIRKALMARGLLEYPPALEKISSMDWTAQHAGIARRPHYGVLDATDSYQRLGKKAEDWHDALHRVVEKLT